MMGDMAVGWGVRMEIWAMSIASGNVEINNDQRLYTYYSRKQSILKVFFSSLAFVLFDGSHSMRASVYTINLSSPHPTLLLSSMLVVILLDVARYKSPMSDLCAYMREYVICIWGFSSRILRATFVFSLMWTWYMRWRNDNTTNIYISISLFAIFSTVCRNCEHLLSYLCR